MVFDANTTGETRQDIGEVRRRIANRQAIWMDLHA